MTTTRHELGAQAEAEAMACIGCNDCMLACPIPQAKRVSIAELNAAVHLPIVHNPRVADFVMACTQCRQCVPVCPADLNRADMVLWNKLKVEEQVPNYTMTLQVGQRIEPSAFTLDGLSDKVSVLPLFAGVDARERRSLLLKATLRQLASNEVVCREGEFYDRLCIVLSGALEQSIRGPFGRQMHILILSPGAFFGEMAVMADQPEPYTVTAMSTTLVLELPKAAVLRLMSTCKAFGVTMDEMYRRRALWTYARTPSALAKLPEQATTELFAQAELRPVRPGEPLVQEGGPVTHVFLVRSGFLRVTRRAEDGSERVLVYFREGDLFGLIGVLSGERAMPFGVQATTRAEVIAIPAAHVLAVMGRHPQARTQLETDATDIERVARSSTFGPPKAAPAKYATQLALTAEVLVEQGLATGTEVLVIDQTRCTNCRACVDACGRRHTYSRLELTGVQIEHLLFPNACRHCEDPVCLLCSVNGIVRRSTGEISIVQDNCIGCGACAERCPYDNIRMHPAEKSKAGPFAGLWAFLRGSSRTPVTHAHDKRMVAVKCDLCAGYEEYACVTACPVGAAFRVDPARALAAEKLAP